MELYQLLKITPWEGKGRGEPRLGEGCVRERATLARNEKERQSTEMRGCGRLATSIARLEQSTLGRYGRWT
jgi:hypothetical protein